jgi:hypothetical protein
MLSVFADCHRCLNNSMSSKNLMDDQLISVQQHCALMKYIPSIASPDVSIVLCVGVSE